MKNLVFDVNVILDLWLERQPEEALLQIAALVASRERGDAFTWVASPSLHVLQYLANRQLKREGMEPAQATETVKRLLVHLLEMLRPLSAFGFDQDTALLRHDDLEDAQIVRAASALQGPTAIVTNDRRFDTTGTSGGTPGTSGAPLLQLSPSEAVVWLREADPSAPMGFVDLKTQQDALRPELERGIHRVLHHGQYILGPEVTELEQRLADYTGAKHCITAASGTDALLISLMALGIGPGDEVITTPFTFVATVEVIVLVGATPVFVDIEPTTCNIDARLIEAKLSDNTKAIMPVSLYGQPADMDAINAIAARHGGLPVIEDAAQSFGADYKSRKSGNLSTLGCTSFFPSKPLGGYGDGGALFTSDDALAQACREIRVHGQSARYIHGRIGIGGRMDSLQCAVVLANLGRFDQDIVQRQAVARRYHHGLADEEGARVNTAHSRQAPNQSQSQNGNQEAPLGAFAPLHEPYRVLPWPAPDRTSVFAQYSLLVRERDVVQARLNAVGIPTAVHYPMPMNQQPAYTHYCCPECTPVAAAVANHIMSLPMHPHLAAAEQARIVEALQRACGEGES